MRPALIFLSYRRDDTGPFALALRAELDLRLDGVPTFLDMNRIQGGNQWAEVLDDALAKATVLIALIGPNWAGEGDDGLTRLSDPKDWVRREVSLALRRPSGAVLPVLVNGARIPDRERLPRYLKKLFEAQTVPLRTQSWDSDVSRLCEVLETVFKVRVKRAGELLPVPNVLKKLEEPLSDEALEQTRQQGLLNGWEVEIVHDVDKTGFVRESLRKRFACASDTQAFEFVHRILPLTRALKHHPKIEMIFKSVVIRLSTLDAGHRITTFDRKMAVEIDKLFNALQR
jgi:pterin-4a-carbinolamine dehydratase